jgi:hypothetical protein
MTGITKPAEAGKWETVRRLRYGALIKLFRHRYGHEFPNEDAGRDDLFVLLCVVSLAPSATDKKMAHVLSLWAPWMHADEAEMYVEHVNRLTIYERMPAAKELGERLNLTNAERERLRLWPIAPVDVTVEQLIEQRAAKRRQQDAVRRRKQGVRSREAYLAELASRPRPWEDEGISQRTWQRRQCREVNRNMSRGEPQTIVIKSDDHLATTERGGSQTRGLQGSGATGRTVRTTEVREVERQELGGSPDVAADPATQSVDPRMAALNNWGENLRKKVRPFRRKKSPRKLGGCFPALLTPIGWSGREGSPRDLSRPQQEARAAPTPCCWPHLDTRQYRGWSDLARNPY